ncbi:MAG: glycosyltransferase [Isosphaeraceae bacterium]
MSHSRFPDGVRPRVSVVIITAGRRQCLPPCLESLRRQTYGPFEVVVVVGPSADGSNDYAATLTDVKVYRVDKLNVAHARNEGVRRSGGDLIAFIDDDAIATSTWLEELVSVFESEGPTCGGVAGMVVNENGLGRPVQALNNTIDDLGEPTEYRLAPSGFNDPEGNAFTYFMGANMAFRREAILDAGGFDETYMYLYEDADMSAAVIRAGYRLFHHARALVHHLPARSHNRRGPFDLNYFAIARHQLYFSLKYSRRSSLNCLWNVARTKTLWLRIFADQIGHRQMTWRSAARHSWNALKGLGSGWNAGRETRRRGTTSWLPADLPRADFRSMTASRNVRRPIVSRSRLRVALLCGEFGGPVFGGVGAYTENLAEALASRGLDVTVLRSANGPSRIVPAGYRVEEVPLASDPIAYRHAFLTTLRSLSDRRDFDLVEAPLWNGEGAAVGLATRWPLVVRLQTPFELTRQISGIVADENIRTMIAAERLQLAYATGVIGISEAVVETVKEAHGIPLATHGRRLSVIPLGMPPVARLPRNPIEPPHAGGTRYLFVGRLEARKGVLELGEAFARVAQRDPKATLWIVGADNSAHDGFALREGRDYHAALRRFWDESASARVHFFGKIDDATKNHLFATCDVLVAPSRYESFGLIFLEAMRFGKPVIGTHVGGVPEVVEHETTGLLVGESDPAALAEAMLRLGASSELRQALGRAGLRRFETRFSLDILGRATEEFYREILDDWRGVRRANPGFVQHDGPPAWNVAGPFAA